MATKAKSRVPLAAAILASTCALVAGTALGQGMRATGDREDCVEAHGQARYSGYGYAHSVHVANRCDHEVVCHVSTDVSPQIQDVRLAPGASTDVATFLASPASTIVPRVDCPHARTPVITDRGE